MIYGFNFGLTCFALFFHIIIHCVSKWKVDLPQYFGNLTDKANRLKPFQIRGVSLYVGFDDGDDREQIVEHTEEKGEREIQPASVDRLPNILFIIRRIVFFIYFLICLGLVIAVIV